MARPLREISRVWEVDWAVPASEGGTRWAAYDWALEQAAELEVDLYVVASTYDALGRADWAIGRDQAARLRVQPHGYVQGGVTVRGVSRRGSWHTRGVVLAAWATDAVLAEIEGHRPDAVAAVCDWPDAIVSWRSLHSPERIGQVRADVEAEYDGAAVVLDERAVRTLSPALALTNESHSVLSTHERERLAGALIALADAGLAVDPEALRGHLMALGWNGRLIGRAVQLAERVQAGQRPRHRPVQVR